jgi:hypothetical protein
MMDYLFFKIHTRLNYVMAEIRLFWVADATDRSRRTKLAMAVRYGVIGCGMMGQEHLRNIALLPGATVTSIFEPNDEMAAASLAMVPGARRAESISAVVTASDVDCLFIASPNFRHAEQLREIAALRDIPVLLESPPARIWMMWRPWLHSPAITKRPFGSLWSVRLQMV